MDMIPLGEVLTKSLPRFLLNIKLITRKSMCRQLNHFFEVKGSILEKNRLFNQITNMKGFLTFKLITI